MGSQKPPFTIIQVYGSFQRGNPFLAAPKWVEERPMMAYVWYVMYLWMHMVVAQNVISVKRSWMVLEMKLILYSNVRYVLWLYAVRTRYSIFCRYVCMFPVTLDLFDEYRSHKNTNTRLWTFVHRKKNMDIKQAILLKVLIVLREPKLIHIHQSKQQWL